MGVCQPASAGRAPRRRPRSSTSAAARLAPGEGAPPNGGRGARRPAGALPQIKDTAERSLPHHAACGGCTDSAAARAAAAAAQPARPHSPRAARRPRPPRIRPCAARAAAFRLAVAASPRLPAPRRAAHIGYARHGVVNLLHQERCQRNANNRSGIAVTCARLKPKNAVSFGLMSLVVP